tara:strand:+ start:544 stop:2064 length:1521 start_codon:yes stop_codon:yes gene_type:complete
LVHNVSVKKRKKLEKKEILAILYERDKQGVSHRHFIYQVVSTIPSHNRLFAVELMLLLRDKLVLVSEQGFGFFKYNKWSTVQPTSIQGQEQPSRKNVFTLPIGYGDRFRFGRDSSIFHVMPGPSPRKNNVMSVNRQIQQLYNNVSIEGNWQNNCKGWNKMLANGHDFKLDLSDPTRLILPCCTLRKLFPKKALIEAIWYLRGESNTAFLQKHNCHFWDAQTTQNGDVGYNYGLMTHFPVNSNLYINQLEEKVLKLLDSGKPSRNMSITLDNPIGRTTQRACTSNLKFCYIPKTSCICLEVTQRSSDIVIGLPFDLIVWSIILHLVVHEANRRTENKYNYKSGTLTFRFQSGSAHVYQKNLRAFELLRRRTLLTLPNQPHLVISERVKTIPLFTMVENYRDGDLIIDEYCSKYGAMKLEVALGKNEGQMITLSKIVSSNSSSSSSKFSSSSSSSSSSKFSSSSSSKFSSSSSSNSSSSDIKIDQKKIEMLLRSGDFFEEGWTNIDKY